MKTAKDYKKIDEGFYMHKGIRLAIHKRTFFIILIVMLSFISLVIFASYKGKDNSLTNNPKDKIASLAENAAIEKLFSKLRISNSKELIAAKDFTLKDLNGNKVSLKDYRNKVVFLSFWATWCSPCVSEMPDIEKLQEQMQDEDFVILTVSLGESKKNVQGFIDQGSYSVNVILDSNKELLPAYGIKGIPATFVIDKKGMIMGKALGPRRWADPDSLNLFKMLSKQ